MPILKNVLGLDLGSDSLKAVEFRKTLRAFEAVKLRSEPRGNGELPLAELVERFVRLHRLTTDHVVSALPGDRTSSRRLNFPFHDARKLSMAVPFEVEGDLPFDLEDVMVDWEIVGGDRQKSEVVATIAQRGDVSSLVEVLRAAGCEPRTLEAEGLVLGNLAAVFDLPGTRLLADIGHRKTVFCLLVDGRAVAARTAPVGGAALTQSLALDWGLDEADAERLKCEEGVFPEGLGSSTPKVAEALERLARETMRTLEALEPLLAGPQGEPVEEITLFGGSAQLDRIDEFLAERTGVPVARLGLPTPGRGKGLAAGGSQLLFAPAIALGLRGTAQARTRTNFRREEFAVRIDLGHFGRQFRPTATLAAVALALAMASFVTSTVLEGRRAAALEREVAQLYSEAFPGEPAPPNALSALREALRSAHQRAEFLGVYGGNHSALDLLTEISKRVPDDLEVVFEELSIDRQTIRMRVHADSFEAADRLGAELARFAPFAQARIGAIETDRRRGGKNFNVTISLASPEDRV